jgi:hypothetical protein
MAHDILEGVCKFCHDCVPYEFIGLMSPMSNVSANDLDLVVNPISNFGSTYESEEQHGAFQWCSHDSGLIIKGSVNVPFHEEVFDFGLISVIDLGFPPH